MKTTIRCFSLLIKNKNSACNFQSNLLRNFGVCNFSLFKNKNCKTIISSNEISTQFFKYPSASFAKKTPDKNDKKVKKEKEKETINKEYANVSVDELKTKYKQKSDGIVIAYKEALNEIRVQRSNPKILDSTQVTIKGKKTKLSDVSTIMLKAANVLVINPFDESHKDTIIKSIEASKLDVQITTEGSSIVVTLGAIPDDMKNESTQKARKLYESTKETMKTLRYTLVSEMKKLEKILGKDEAQRIEKGLLEILDKSGKQIDQSNKKKEEEIKSS